VHIVYLESTVDDLLWMRHYYEQVFPAGSKNAQRQIHSTEILLLENPEFGHRTHRKDTRELSIPGIPFSFIYRANPQVIEIIRVWDERQDRAGQN
jgi:plasmid stabilization system protein ParE